MDSVLVRRMDNGFSLSIKAGDSSQYTNKVCKDIEDLHAEIDSWFSSFSTIKKK